MVKVEIEKEKNFHQAPKEDLGFTQAIELLAESIHINQLRMEEIPKLSIR
jgi:hypothetical protein